MTLQSNPRLDRAACSIWPVPMYWMGETAIVTTEGPPNPQTGQHSGIRFGEIRGTDSEVLLRHVQSHYVLLSAVDMHGWQIFEGDDRLVLGQEMQDLAATRDFPGRERVALAGRMIERAARVPGRVVSYGR